MSFQRRKYRLLDQFLTSAPIANGAQNSRAGQDWHAAHYLERAGDLHRQHHCRPSADGRRRTLIAQNWSGALAQATKRLEAMRRNPAGDWQIDDIAAVCRAFGVECVAPARGSHYRVAHAAMPAILTIPARRPIKPVYIRLLLAYIDAVEAATKHE